MSTQQKDGALEPLVSSQMMSSRWPPPRAAGQLPEGYSSTPPGRTASSARATDDSSAFGFLDGAERQLFCTKYQIEDADAIQLLPESSCGTKLAKTVGCLAVPGLGWLYGLCNLKLIPKGDIGMVMNSGRPELIGPGWHAVVEPLRKWQGKVSLSDEVIQFATKEIITVKDGFVGLAWDRGEPVLLPPGMHQWDSSTLKFEKTFDRKNAKLEIGPFTFCTIQKGDVGVSFDRGELSLLPAGYHVLKHALHKFSHNISVRQQFDALKSSKLLSQDTVELDLDATVSWQVEDAEAAALNARNMDHLRELVHRQARAALSECVFKMAVSTSSNAPSGLSQSADSVLGSTVVDGGVAAPIEPEELGRTESRTQEAQSVSSLSEATSSEETLRQCNAELMTIGVKINKIAIVKLDITDVEVLRVLAKGATIAVAIREKRKVAEVEAESTVLQARAKAEGRRLEAQAEAYAERQRADAQKYYSEKVAESAAVLGAADPLAGQLMLLHGSADVLEKTASSLVITAGGSDVASTLLGNAGFVKMPSK
jgi:regulator of protease activity HflC (stomatin/prohibitin superfamily)